MAEGDRRSARISTKVTPEFRKGLDIMLVDIGWTESEYVRTACETFLPRFTEFVEAFRKMKQRTE